jgi:hypothetical protein
MFDVVSSSLLLLLYVRNCIAVGLFILAMLCYFKLSEASLKIALNIQSKTGGGEVFTVITVMAGAF